MESGIRKTRKFGKRKRERGRAWENQRTEEKEQGAADKNATVSTRLSLQRETSPPKPVAEVIKKLCALASLEAVAKVTKRAPVQMACKGSASEFANEKPQPLDASFHFGNQCLRQAQDSIF